MYAATNQIRLKSRLTLKLHSSRHGRKLGKARGLRYRNIGSQSYDQTYNIHGSAQDGQ